MGKSSVRASFGGGAFNPRHDMTIGVEFESKVIDLQGLPVRLSIYDTVRVLCGLVCVVRVRVRVHGACACAWCVSACTRFSVACT